MALIPPPAPTAAPTPPIQRGDRATFSNRVDAAITYLTNAPAEIGNIATITYGNAQEAYTYSQTTLGYRDTTLTYRNEAQTARTDAQQARTDAQAARDLAQTYSQALTGASTTSNTIGTGAKTFSGSGLASKQFYVGQRVRALNPANAAQRMDGTVTAYVNNGASSSLSVAVDNINTATAGNTVANWLIGPGGEVGGVGPTGGVAGGNLTGALNDKLGNSVPVSAAPDIWNAGGNVIFLTGAGAITSFSAAPQAGARRTAIIMDTGVTIAGDANLLLYGGNQVLAAGDMLEVVAETTTKFRVTARKRDGTPVVHDRGDLPNIREYTTSGVFTAPRDGWYKLTTIGGAGSGGAACGVITTGKGLAGGGGAGGFARGMRYLTGGQSYVVSVGAGGVSASANVGAASNGSPGSASQFSGTGIATIRAEGGSGGMASTSAASVAGGAGGAASGGDINTTGGAGGAAAVSVANGAAAGGGGSVSLKGAPYAGGSASVTAASAIAAGAGAGVGGKGGDATSNQTNVQTFATGGGAAGAAINATNGSNTGQAAAGIDWRGIAGGVVPVAVRDGSANPLNAALGGGSYGGIPSPQPGGGGSANSSALTGGSFAGGGGFCAINNAGSVVSGAGGAYGGASGGCAHAGGSVSSPAGQPGVVIIEW